MRQERGACFYSSNLAQVLICPQPAEHMMRPWRGQEGPATAPLCPHRQHVGPTASDASHSLLVIFLPRFLHPPMLSCFHCVSSISPCLCSPTSPWIQGSYAQQGACPDAGTVLHLFPSSSSPQPEFCAGRIPTPSIGTHHSAWATFLGDL